MATYTTIANITKVAFDGKFYIKGVGKYSYERNNDEKYIVLENEAIENSKIIKEDSLQLSYKGEFLNDFLVVAMMNKKSLKLAIDEDKGLYSISAIEVP